jgi:cytoskeletal protein CcmA (bactofilin family)
MNEPYDRRSRDSVLGPTLRFKGELTAEEDLLILGSVEGSIKHMGRLTVGEQGQVKANIEASEIVVEGKVEGDLHAATSISVRASAQVSGNIFAPAVTLVEGAKFKGLIDMDVKKPASVGAAPSADARPAAIPTSKSASA